MEAESIDRAAAALAETLALIDSDNLDASAEQVAYLRGALDALRSLSQS